MTTENDLIARKEADAPYHAALHDLRLTHDADLVQLLADVREGLIDPKTLAVRKAGIANRYDHAAKRLARQYGKEGHDGA